MSKTIIGGCLVLFGMVWFSNNALSQQKNYKNTLRYGIGYGSYHANDVEGSGFMFQFGYMRSLKNERARINTYFSSGGYGAKKLTDVREQWFTSRNLGCNIFYDVIDETGFAVTLGTGLLANQMKGLMGDATDASVTEDLDSEYVSSLQMGGYLGAGFRIKNYDHRFYIDVMPLNLHFGRMAYLDLYSTVNLNLLF
jgi:hypothetical protein